MVRREELPLLFGGATLTGAVDGILEMIWASDPEKWKGKFPYIGTIEPLPPVDDWIVLGIPAAAYGIGHFTKRESVKAVGIGGLLYAVPMFIHHIILRARAMTGVKFQKYERYPAELPLIKEI